MADAKRCDRCGSYYMENEKTVSIRSTYDGSFTYYNLCDSCVEKIVSFMEQPELGDAALYNQRMRRVKQGYINSDVCMSEYLRTCCIPLTVEEKRKLLEYAGEDEYVVVLDNGEIVEKKKEVQE